MKIFIPDMLSRKLRYFASHTREVSGLGEYVVCRGGVEIKTLDIIPTTGTAAHTRMSAEAIAEWELSRPRDSVYHGFIHWHTHPRMSAFWSGTDTTMLDQWRDESGGIVAIVSNEKGEMKGAVIRAGDPSRGYPELDERDVPVVVVDSFTQPDEWKSELDRGCLPEPQAERWQGYQGGYGGCRDYGRSSWDSDNWEMWREGGGYEAAQTTGAVVPLGGGVITSEQEDAMRKTARDLFEERMDEILDQLCRAEINYTQACKDIDQSLKAIWQEAKILPGGLRKSWYFEAREEFRIFKQGSRGVVNVRNSQ